MKIVIISTPRSGNTWLRRMLATLFNAEQIAEHSPEDIDWENLPNENCLLQLHWRRTEEFKSFLIENNFKIVTLQRHPLDVLLSILQFAYQEPQTAQWLNGEGGDEKIIYVASPISETFFEYATSVRAHALLSVSAEWGDDPNTIVVRYEDMVNDTEKALNDLLVKLGTCNISQAKIAKVIDSNSIDKSRLTSNNGHFWQGKVGLWQKLIPFHIAEKIAVAQQEIFLAHGYEPLLDSGLTTIEAKRHWRALCQ